MRFLHQSQSEVWQNQTNHGLLSTLNSRRLKQLTMGGDIVFLSYMNKGHSKFVFDIINDNIKLQRIAYIYRRRYS